jgi:hypothetical protein
MEKIYAVIDGKEYTKNQYVIHIGDLCNRSIVKILREKGWSDEQIHEFTGFSYRTIRLYRKEYQDLKKDKKVV